ncbi:hypothetical protein DD570_22455 [Klebsiella pneumoniae]|nr:hypothetical protein DD570_22455 [Klebsiella pneumoniae]HBY1013346.1 hypothetical protein [Klebsiella pneumoniae]
MPLLQRDQLTSALLAKRQSPSGSLVSCPLARIQVAKSLSTGPINRLSIHFLRAFSSLMQVHENHYTKRAGVAGIRARAEG